MLKMWGSYFQGHQILDKEIVKSCGNFLLPLFFNFAITIVIFFFIFAVFGFKYVLSVLFTTLVNTNSANEFCWSARR